MSDWKPEVGQEVVATFLETTDGTYEYEIVVEHVDTDKIMGRLRDMVWPFKFNDFSFRPMQTEADKLRDEQIMLLAQAYLEYEERSANVGAGAHLYEAGCRITRELTTEVREKLRTRFILEAISEDPDAFIDLVAAYVRGELDMEPSK